MSIRLQNLQAVMPHYDIDALLITAPINRHYISGFRGSSGALLVTPDQALLLTDFRYAARAAEEAPAFTLHQIRREYPLYQAVAAWANLHGLRRIGIEAGHMTVAQHEKLLAALAESERTDPPVLVLTEQVVEELREVKDETELLALRRAIELTDETFATIVPTFTPDHTERQAAWLLERALREHGAEAVAFDIIVAAGPNAARPHAVPGDGLLGTGQPIVIDLGARYAGYHADLTRTIVLGEPDAQFYLVYGAVHVAQQRALAGIRPGISGADADALARTTLEEAGYGEAFGHSLGHGVGLDIHEGPTLARTSERILRAGNVVSVEPGVYLDGWGGVRIEDLVLVTGTGCEILSHAPRLGYEA